MEVGTTTRVMLELGVEEEDVVFVAVEGEDTMDLTLIHNKTEDTIKNHLLRTAAVAMEGELAEEAVVTDQMDRSRQPYKLPNAFLKDCGLILICAFSLFYYRPIFCVNRMTFWLGSVCVTILDLTEIRFLWPFFLCCRDR